MDQSGTYLEKFKKAQEQATQPTVPTQPTEKPRSQAEIFSEKRRKAEAVNKFMSEVRAQEAAKPKPEGGISKAAGSGLQEFALSIPGAFGDIPRGALDLSSYAATYGIPYAAEKVGLPFSEEAKKGLEGGRETFLGATSKFLPPTTEEYKKMVQPTAEKMFGVGPMYEPQNPAEAMTKTTLGVGLPAVMGRPTGAIRRTASGMLGAGTSEAAGQLVESTDYANASPYVRMGALALSPFAFDKFPIQQAGKITEGALGPTSAAKKNIAEGIGSFGKKSEVMAHRMALGKNVSEVAAKMPERIRQFNVEITGIVPDSAEYADLLGRVGKVERDRVFGIARANPNSDAIDISGLGNLQSHPLFLQAEEAARKNAVNAPDYDIIPPQVIPGRPSQTTHGASGFVTTPSMPSQRIDGNLNYYQQVKEELDVMIKKANATGDYTTARGAQQIKNKLLDTIDPQVPEYRDALQQSRLTFGMEEAPEAGAKFFEKYDTFKDNEFRRSFNNYTPEEQNAFRVGFLGRLEQDLGQGRDQALKLFVKNPAFQKKVEFVFGPEIAGEIRAKYLSEAMLQRAARIDQAASSAEAVSAFEKSKRLLTGPGIVAGVGYAVTDIANQAFLANLLQQSGIGLVPATVAAASAIGALGGKFALNAAEKRIATKMVQLINSNDPADYAKLNRLIDRNPAVYPKMMTILEAARTSTELYGLPKEAKPAALPTETLDQTYDRLVKEGKIPAQAAGGRVGRASGGRIEIQQGVRALMRAMEDAKKSVTKSTENLLQMPDEHVAQSLEAAKRLI